MKRTDSRYVVCVKNDDYRASLELRKLYRVLAAEPNDPPSMVRIQDEDDDDYLYPADWFVPVMLPAKTRQALANV